MDRTEAIAKYVIERALPGACVMYVSDQSQGNYDFNLTLPDGRDAILEVTRSTEEVHKALESEVRRELFVPVGRCRNGWYVYLGKQAHVKTVRRKIDDYLADVEAEGRTEFSAFTDACESPAVLRLWEELCVEVGTVMQWKGGPAIGLATPGVEGSPSPREVSRAVETEAQKPDNLRKLTSGTAHETHIAVIVERYSYSAWLALNDATPGECSPCIDSRITHTWAIAMTRDADKYVTWLYSTGGTWKSLGIIVVTEADITRLATS